jgi:hypothetical protein
MRSSFQEALENLNDCEWLGDKSAYLQALAQVSEPAAGWGQSYKDAKVWAQDQDFLLIPDAYFRFKASALLAAAQGRPWHTPEVLAAAGLSC